MKYFIGIKNKLFVFLKVSSLAKSFGRKFIPPFQQQRHNGLANIYIEFIRDCKFISFVVYDQRLTHFWFICFCILFFSVP